MLYSQFLPKKSFAPSIKKSNCISSFPKSMELLVWNLVFVLSSLCCKWYVLYLDQTKINKNDKTLLELRSQSVGNLNKLQKTEKERRRNELKDKTVKGQVNPLDTELICIQLVPHSTKFYTGRIRPEFQTLTLLYTIFNRKRYPFRIPPIENCTPFIHHLSGFYLLLLLPNVSLEKPLKIILG